MTDDSTDRTTSDVRRTIVAPVETAAQIIRDRRDTSAILILGTISYFLLYAYTSGALTRSRRQSMFLQVVDTPLTHIFERTGVYTFEPIARIGALGFSYLFSPIDASLAALLALLVGSNLAVSYLVLVQPRACGLTPGSGLVAAVPALLSGAACCGPIIFVILGIQATGILLTGFNFLLPLSAILLSTTLIVVGRQIGIGQESRPA